MRESLTTEKQKTRQVELPASPGSWLRESEDLKDMNQAPIGKATAGQSSSRPRRQFPCEYALRKKGVDEVFIAQRLVDMLEAKGKRWNAATKSWETFEDYKAQLAAIEQAARLLGLFPTRKALEEEHKPHEVIFSVVYEDSSKARPRPVELVGSDSTAGHAEHDKVRP